MNFKLVNIALILAAGAVGYGSAQATGTKVGHYVDPNIGGVAPLLTTVTPQVHRPHSMVRIYPLTEPSMSDRYLSDHVYGIGLNMPRYRLGETSSIMATTGDVKADVKATASWCDHDLEELHPWLHKIHLDDYAIDASWTTTERTSAFRFDFRNKGKGNVIFRVFQNGEIAVTDNKIISGWESVEYAKQYFYAVADKPFATSGIISNGKVSNGKSASGANIGAWLSTGKAENIGIRVGISFISVEQAKENLEKESLGKTFDQIVAESERIWENSLGRIRVEGGTDRERRIFYTSFYRTFERMVNHSEGDRYYSGFDRSVHTDSVPFYNDDWIWDTYRNLHGLQLLLNPEQKALHMKSYVRMYEQWGWVPNFPELTEWNASAQTPWASYLKSEPMIGNHTASLLAEVIRKGITDFDIEKAYEGIRKNALEGTMIPWRSGAATELDKFYAKNGFIPGLAPGEGEKYEYVDHSWEKRQAVSVTIEHSYDDWCLAQVAKYLGKEDDYKLLMERSRNYLKLWNPEIGYFAPKNEKGEWVTPYDPQLCEGSGARSYFAEVNACVHQFHIQHDIDMMIKLMGGNEGFINKLDAAYNEGAQIGKWKFMGMMPDATGLQGMIPAGNEPAFHIPYLYNYAGAAWKTQHRVRQVADMWFDDRPTGLSGDDDGGSLCAWYVFSAMGFYPVNPVSGEYAIGSPIFSKIEMALPDGKTFTVLAPGASRRNKYIQSAKLNGKPLNRAFITHEDITGGSTLELVMGEMPNKQWGNDPK